MGALAELDHFLFRLINRDGSNAFFDWLMPAWTDLHKNAVVFIPILLILISFAFWKYRRAGLLGLVFAILAGFAADFLNSHVIKPLFMRPRPEFAHLPFEVIIRGPHYSGSSFPSSHSLVMFCIAGILSTLDRRLFWIVTGLAALTAYSRVYCGAHFPTDVIGGALIGFWIGRLLTELAIRVWPFGHSNRASVTKRP